MAYTTFALIALGFAIGVWAFRRRLTAALRVWRSFDGVRLVTCPETGNVAAVGFNRSRAALTALLHQEADVQLAHCSRWTSRGPCEQACLTQAKACDSALTTLVGRWSAGHGCALCGSPLVEAPFVRHHVALRSCDGATREWTDVVPETLPETLRTGQPVCWNCHIAETFRRRHPELITDR
jgi:hypothetical protein